MSAARLSVQCRLALSLCILMAACLSSCVTTPPPVTDHREDFSTEMQRAYAAAGLNQEAATELLINRFTYGWSAELEQALQDADPGIWLYEQMHSQTSSDTLDKRLLPLDALQMDDSTLMATYPTLSGAMAHMRRFYPGLIPPKGEPIMDFSVVAAKVGDFGKQHGLRKMKPSLLPQLEGQRIFRAVYSPNQLREVMVDFWSNHFYTSTRSFSARPWVMGFERDVLRAGALADFPSLLQESTAHPAMLAYFSRDAQPAEINEGGSLMDLRAEQLRDQGQTEQLAAAHASVTALDDEYSLVLDRRFWPASGPNTVFARQLLKQQTLGDEQLFSDADTLAVAQAFTGWSTTYYGPDDRWYQSDEQLAEVLGFVRDGSFWFRADRHDPREKTVLGQRLPAGQGVEDGYQILQLLAKHPATAQHIANKILQQIAGDNTSLALQSTVADAYTHAQGSITAMLTAMVTHEDFWRAASQHEHVKTPLQFVASALRCTDAHVTSTAALSDWLARMGQPLYGYLDASGYPTDDHYWLAAGALLERFRFAQALEHNEIEGVNLTKQRTAPNQLTLLLASPEFQLY